jgi:hypothetical protein
LVRHFNLNCGKLAFGQGGPFKGNAKRLHEGTAEPPPGSTRRRGPGRPRRVALPTQSDVQSAGTAKRPRGRPRKALANAQPESVAMQTVEA